MIAELNFHSDLPNNQMAELAKKLNEVIQHINEQEEQ